MNLVNNSIIPPKEWHHDPELLEDNNEGTIALKLAKKGIIPPKEWHHSPLRYDDNHHTVAELLFMNNIYPSDEWLYDNPII